MLRPHRSHRNLIHLEERVEGPFFVALILAGALPPVSSPSSLPTLARLMRSDNYVCINVSLASLPRSPTRPELLFTFNWATTIVTR